MSKLEIFLCAVLFASAANASPWSDAFESVQQKVTGAIDATINKIKDTYEAVHMKAGKVVARLLEEASNANEKIKESVEKILGRLEDEIAELKSEAEDVDATECTKMFSHLEFTGLSVISDMSNCVTDKLKTGTGYIENMVKISEDALGNLTEIREETLHCGDDIDGITSTVAAIACVNAAAVKATWVSAKVIPEMSLEFVKLSALLETLQPSLAYCTASSGLATFHEESSSIVDRTKKCIQQKIDEVRDTVTESDGDHNQE